MLADENFRVMTGRERVRGTIEGSWAYQVHAGAPYIGALSWGRPARKVTDVTQGGTVERAEKDSAGREPGELAGAGEEGLWGTGGPQRGFNGFFERCFC